MEKASSGSCCTTPSQSPLKHMQTSVQFKGNMRPHISINVADVPKSTAFYEALFNQKPVKVKLDYSKFEPANPPVNFAINQVAVPGKRDGHFGIQVKSRKAVQDFVERFRKTGVKIEETESAVACCYSVQDKVWLTDPDGNHWEVFVVTEKEADEGCGVTCVCYNAETGGCDWT